MKRPAKPHPDFPLTPHGNGQWCKKIKGKVYYFGRWKEDREGKAALADWLARKDAIFGGMDQLRVATVEAGMTMGRLMGMFLEAKRTAAMIAKELSATTYGDYLRELQAFANATGTDAEVAKLKPEHFAAYAKALITERKLGRHARKRTIAYIKAMLNWGADNGYYPTPTFGTGFVAPETTPDAIRMAKAREGKPDHSERIVTGDELNRLIERANPQFKAVILLAANCAMGPADMGRLRWRDIDMETGALDMPRGKTGFERRGYLWKRTRKALARVAILKHNAQALKRGGQEALIFWTRKGLPVYRETEIVKDGKSVGMKIENALSITIGRYADELKLEGVSLYRLRHTFKTLSKKAKDSDAENLCMGHRNRTTGDIYDHEKIEFGRIKKVAKVVHCKLWPKTKPTKVSQPAEHAEGNQRPMMRLVGGADEAVA
jgi:integrase